MFQKTLKLTHVRHGSEALVQGDAKQLGRGEDGDERVEEGDHARAGLRRGEGD